MIHNSDELNRRAFNFPAIKPCECTSPKTLINSLISISSEISNFKSHHLSFTSNKRNANTVIRLINVLRVFLSELRDGAHSDIPRSATSSLLELHVILQKLHSLLQCLTRPDARVWMLINSDAVAGNFQTLIGEISGALEGVDFNGEERDYVLFVINQGNRLRFEVEKDDVWALNLIFFVLGQFEKRVIPGPNDLRRVMDHLGIKNWTDCNKQVKFLEEETGSDPRSIGLMGLMVYCQCVLFHDIDGEHRRIEAKGENGMDMDCFNPDDFKCPISLEIMTDPVTISSGQTYDRGSIVKWFKSGNPVCPKTGQKLESLSLVPNLVLKKLIKQYCLEKGIPSTVVKEKGMTKGGYVGNLVAQEAMRMVADFLSIKLAMGTMMEKTKAAYEIRLLTKRNVFNRACLVESGTIPYLLNLLLSKDSITQENSMAALLNLSKHPESRATIVNKGGLALVIGVLRSGIKIEARQHAAASLFYLSSVEEYRRLIGNNPDAIPSLVELIRVGGDRSKKNALVTLFGLLLLPSNHYRVLEARLVPLLVTLLGTMEREDLVIDSLVVLSALADKPDGARVILRGGALNITVGILSSSSYNSSRFVREHCVSLLLALCINCGREVVAVLVKNTSLMGALYSLLTEGTSRTSKKASSLISIMHEFSETSSSQSMPPHALPHENFIHVW